MPLKLVLGPANSAKAGEVLGAYDAAAHRGALLVVPTALDADHYGRELAERGTVLGSVLTFSGLAGEIARRTGYAGHRISPLQRELVLRRVVRGLEFEVLARSATAPGFVSAAGELIAELHRSLITPQRFTEALGRWASHDRERGAYVHEIARLYAAYSRELDRLGRVDRELFAWRALDALRAQPGRWGETAVFFYGFDDLLPLERDAIETLSRIAGAQVTVSLTYEPGRAALSARAEVVAELRAIAQETTELPALDEYYVARSRPALHHLERRLFEPGSERIDPADAVRLLEAGGERAEAELVAAEVLELLRDGVALEEIVVVCRRLARTAPLFARVLSRYGIPVRSRHPIAFTHTALGRSVRALARCAVLAPERTRAQDLIDYLRTPGRVGQAHIADGLEAEVRREGVLTAIQAAERLNWKLEEISAVRDAPNPLAELARQARRLFAAPRRARASVLGVDEELDARALTTLLDAQAQLDELGERPGGLELIELLEGLEIAPQRMTTSGAVLLAEPLAIRARRFRAVFVCGLNEGEFPLPGIPDPFLSDEHRRELALASGLRLAPAENVLERERYLLYACVSSATERITFGYRSSDEEGNLALPSPFLADVAEVLTLEWASRRRRRLLADVVWDVSSAPTERELARVLAAEDDARIEPSRRAWELGSAALAQVRHRQVVSAGALECFDECAVKWLVEKEIGPARLEPDPEPLARGTYMHTALEEVIGRLGSSVTPESLPDARRILEDVLEEMPPDIAPGRPEAVRAGELRAIAADLRRYLEHEARDGCGWRQAGLELRFGFESEEGALPAVVLGEGPDNVLVRGMIDRVDVEGAGSDRAIVRDYKSGSRRPEHQGSRWQADGQLQVALYMLAVRELLGLNPVAGLYQPLRGDDLRPRGVFLEGIPGEGRLVGTDARSADELEDVLADARRRALALARRLRAGELTPNPQTCSREGCRYPGICRSP